MTTDIKITTGIYTGKAGTTMTVSAITAPMIGEYVDEWEGGSVMIDGTNISYLPNGPVKITVASQSALTVKGGGPLPKKVETDEEIIERLDERFDMLTDLTKAVKAGKVKSMMVVGPPGVGKSWGVTEVLEKHEMLKHLAGQELETLTISGGISDIGLYQQLYMHRKKNNVLVFDDCDMIFFDDACLNLLKAATDTGRKRKLHWLKESRTLIDADIPNEFEFNGSIIFISNLRFDNVKSKKLRDHLAAMETRFHILDLQMDSEREVLLRIESVVNKGMLDELALEDDVKDQIMVFTRKNAKRFHKLSLRSVLKAAELATAFPTTWQGMAEQTLLKRKP